MLKTSLKALAIIIVILAVVIVGGLISVFGNNMPVEHGASYGPATVIEDVSYVSIFLVDAGDGKFVLIDGGVDTEAVKLKALLAEKGATEKDLLAVLFTHAHSDHIGAAYALTEVPLYVHKADVRAAEGKVAPAGGMPLFTPVNPSGLKVTHPLDGGEVLEFGNVRIEVFHTPGHTPGNVAYKVDDILILGDTAQVTKDHRLHSPPQMFSGDPAQAIESIRTLSKAISKKKPADHPTLLVGSHSGPTKNVQALLGYDGD